MLLIQSSDPLIVPGIDEHSFIRYVAGELPPSGISYGTQCTLSREGKLRTADLYKKQDTLKSLKRTLTGSGKFSFV